MGPTSKANARQRLGKELTSNPPLPLLLLTAKYTWSCQITFFRAGLPSPARETRHGPGGRRATTSLGPADGDQLDPRRPLVPGGARGSGRFRDAGPPHRGRGERRGGAAAEQRPLTWV